jgi:hypothetical protein
MVAWASMVFPLISRRKKTTFSRDLAPRCLAGVKNPRVLRFFSILTNSLGGLDSMFRFGVTATETDEGPFGVRTVFRIAGFRRVGKLLMRKGQKLV